MECKPKSHFGRTTFDEQRQKKIGHEQTLRRIVVGVVMILFLTPISVLLGSSNWPSIERLKLWGIDIINDARSAPYSENLPDIVLVSLDDQYLSERSTEDGLSDISTSRDDLAKLVLYARRKKAAAIVLDFQLTSAHPDDATLRNALNPPEKFALPQNETREKQTIVILVRNLSDHTTVDCKPVDFPRMAASAVVDGEIEPNGVVFGSAQLNVDSDLRVRSVCPMIAVQVPDRNLNATVPLPSLSLLAAAAALRYTNTNNDNEFLDTLLAHGRLGRYPLDLRDPLPWLVEPLLFPAAPETQGGAFRFTSANAPIELAATDVLRGDKEGLVIREGAIFIVGATHAFSGDVHYGTHGRKINGAVAHVLATQAMLQRLSRPAAEGEAAMPPTILIEVLVGLCALVVSTLYWKCCYPRIECWRSAGPIWCMLIKLLSMLGYVAIMLLYALAVLCVSMIFFRNALSNGYHVDFTLAIAMVVFETASGAVKQIEDMCERAFDWVRHPR